MNLSRRDYLSLGGYVLLSSCGFAPSRVHRGPLVWAVERDGARVHVFGFGTATDRTWLTPAVERALHAASDVWFETPPPGASGNAALIALRLGYDRSRSLFDALDPDLLRRTLDAAARFNLPRERLEPMRPWLARDTIQRAYQASGQAAAVESEYADKVIGDLAAAQGKARHYEFASVEEVLQLFASMNDQAQVEYLRDMLDYIDDAAAGKHVDSDGWIRGEPTSFFIDKMRRDSPALYEVMHVRRNIAWAERIDREMLVGTRTTFVVVGLNHVLGPDSILTSLAARGLQPREVGGG